VPSGLRTGTIAHVAGGVAAAVFVVVWWWWLPNVMEEVANKKYGFGWIVVWLLAGMAVSYATVAIAVFGILRLTRKKRRQPIQRIEPH